MKTCCATGKIFVPSESTVYPCLPKHQESEEMGDSLGKAAVLADTVCQEMQTINEGPERFPEDFFI